MLFKNRAQDMLEQKKKSLNTYTTQFDTMQRYVAQRCIR